MNKEVTNMNFTKTKSARFLPGAVLVMALLPSVPAFAIDTDEATLTKNEHAAQDAIAYAPSYGVSVRNETANAALAYNEEAARQAITHTPADGDAADLRINPVSSTTTKATLMHNELSAQHAIVDARASTSLLDARRSSAALNAWTSSPSGAPR
jgi:hypothetical protein